MEKRAFGKKKNSIKVQDSKQRNEYRKKESIERKCG